MGKHEKTLFCGPLGFGIQQFLGKRQIVNVLSWFGNKNIHYVYRGRTAIRHACRLLGLGQGVEVLAPAYNCGSEIDALLHAGTSVCLYKIDRSLRIDLNDLYNRITRKTKAIYITHYFGFPQEVDNVRQICVENGLYLIEDCALSLFSRDGEKKLGTIGDVSVFSFPKTLPLPDGGALLINTPGLITDSWERRRAESFTILKYLLPLLKSSILRWLSERQILNSFWTLFFSRKEGSFADANAGDEILPDMPADYYYSEQMTDKSISTISNYLLRTFEVKSIIHKRRSNFSLFLEVLSGCHNIEPVFRLLAPGVCPLYFPVIVKNRNKVCARLNERFIAAIPWWAGYHRHLPWAGFADACFLKDSLLALPVHQELEQEHILFIADSLKELIK